MLGTEEALLEEALLEAVSGRPNILGSRPRSLGSMPPKSIFGSMPAIILGSESMAMNLGSASILGSMPAIPAISLGSERKEAL